MGIWRSSGVICMRLDVIRDCNARHVLKRFTGEDGVCWPDRGEESMIFVELEAHSGADIKSMVPVLENLCLDL